MDKLVLACALTLALVAGYFSIFGLQKLFIGAGISIIIMGSILEISKLVTVSFLHDNLSKLNTLLKFYLLSAVGVLMLITSLGIYGYLAAGYNSTSIKVQRYEQVIESNNKQILEINKQLESVVNFDFDKYNKLIEQEQNQIQTINDRLTELDNVLQNIKDSQRGFFKKKDNSYEIQLSKQSSERDSLEQLKKLSFDKIASYKKDIGLSQNKHNEQQLNEQKDRLYKEIEQSKLDISKTDIGTFRFISDALNLKTDSAVNLFILIIMFTFDPLAISLLICYNICRGNMTKGKRKTIKNSKIKNKYINMNDKEFKKLSKDQLEELARKYGLELDRRILKSKMVKQLKDHIDSLDKSDLEAIAREDGVELDKRLKKETLVEQVADIGAPVVEESVQETDEQRRQRLRNLNI